MEKVESVSHTPAGRRKLLAWIGILSVFPLWKMRMFSKKRSVIDCSPGSKNGTMQVLSQDGQLVEVDVSKINILQQKISDKELRDWIKKP
ncbi:hypothetical protein A3860_19800 [Niastella vici]|uniref:Uncharacterized protein n=1 Tax=Niastella vici TaxID=1703345 RepID=A0A1V9G0Y1_9BACT|nr:hypothetical protein [Niastella vici]OQP64224.1 hypothetical protein A3860_19800 [Niastella vici]